MSAFKPLLSATYTPAMELKFPYLASPKLDGIRCVVRDGVALSRTLKPIPNKHIQSFLGDARFNGFDGEIIVGDPTHPDCFRNTTTVVMSQDKVVDNFTYWVFDHTDTDLPFEKRLGLLEPYLGRLKEDHVNFLEQVMLHSQREFDNLEPKSCKP